MLSFGNCTSILQLGVNNMFLYRPEDIVNSNTFNVFRGFKILKKFITNKVIAQF